MNDTNTPTLEIATKRFHEARRAVEAACLVELRQVVLEFHPTAIAIELEGWYGDTDFNVDLSAVRLADYTKVKVVDDEDWPELADAVREYTTWLETVAPENYEDKTTISFTDIPAGTETTHA